MTAPRNWPEEGDPCPLTPGCAGHLKIKTTENCSCHINPPCSGCVDAPLFCEVCNKEVEDE